MNMKTNTEIKQFAIKAHESVNHTYGDGLPYSYHLQQVVDFAIIFGNDIPEADFQSIIIPACWLHDVIEDCRMTYNEVKEVAGMTVANTVYALTNEKGKNRKERANDKYYQGIKDDGYAVFVKLCDRLANIKHSKESGSSMLLMYEKEHFDFVKRLDAEKKYPDMVRRMEEMMNITHAL